MPIDIKTILKNMSLEQKTGQMVWCPFYGFHASQKDRQAARGEEMARIGALGGMLFKSGELYETATRIQKIQQGLELPLAVAAEVENGLGSLLSRGTHFPSNMAFGATRSGEYAFLAGKITAEECRAVGINTIIGPTCSRVGVAIPEGLPRVESYGEKLHLVTRLSTAFMKGVHNGGAVAAPRYFPGAEAIFKGEFTGSRWLYHLRKLLVDTELGVFELLSEAGLAALIVDWREMPDLISGKMVPAITDRNLVDVFLREVLGFKGVAMTPDLSERHMAHLLEPENLIAMINAGVDVLAGVPDPEKVCRTLLDAIYRERISITRVEQAAERVLTLRHRLKKNTRPISIPDEIDRRVASPANMEVADRVAEDSITLLRDRKHILPLDPALRRSLLNLTFSARFESDLEKDLHEYLGKTFERVSSRQIDSRVEAARLDEAWMEAQAADVILCCMFTNQGPEYTAHGFSTIQVDFVRRLIDIGKPLIMASFGDPRAICLFPEVDCYLCLYSSCRASQSALINDLFGKLVMPVKGKLPITLDRSLPYGFGLDLA
jgi:beta-N-acetylhexosaminidase